MLLYWGLTLVKVAITSSMYWSSSSLFAISSSNCDLTINNEKKFSVLCFFCRGQVGNRVPCTAETTHRSSFERRRMKHSPKLSSCIFCGLFEWKDILVTWWSHICITIYILVIDTRQIWFHFFFCIMFTTYFLVLHHLGCLLYKLGLH